MLNRYLPLAVLLVGSTFLIGSSVSAQQPARPMPKGAPKAADRPMPKPGDAPRTSGKPVTPSPKDAKDDIKDRAKDARDDAKDRAKDAKDSKDDTKDRAKDARDDAKDRVKDTKDTAKDRAKDTKDTAKDRADDRRDARDDAKDRRDDAKDRSAAKVDAKGSATAKTSRKFDAAKVKTDDLGISFKEVDKGLTVSNLTRESVLANAGFRTGDQIVSINGQNVVRQSDFVSYLFGSNVTGRVPVVVMRNGVRDTVYVRPTTIIRDYERVVVDDRHDPIRAFGLVLDNRYDDRLMVDRVIKDSRADQAGVKVDDEILAVNDRDVDSRNELARVLEKYEGEQIDMEVRRDRQAKVIEVKVLR